MKPIKVGLTTYQVNRLREGIEEHTHCELCGKLRTPHPYDLLADPQIEQGYLKVKVLCQNCRDVIRECIKELRESETTDEPRERGCVEKHSHGEGT